MKIALTADPELPVPPVHYGGIERIVHMLACELNRQGHEVTLIAHADSTCPVSREAWPGASSLSRIDVMRNCVRLGQVVCAGRFDIVHSFSRIAYLGMLLPLGVPKLMSYQRVISPRTTGRAHRLARGSLEFTAVSRWMIEAEPLSGCWHVVPNGVSLATYAPRDHVAPDAPLVFVGRVEAIKGPHLAIEVARASGRRLVIAGNVPEGKRDWFDTQVAPHIDGRQVRFVGPVNDREKNELLGQAAAFLMPILWEEPFGIVMAEAMACGTPVIGFRRGAVPEVVADGSTGFVVDTVPEMVAAVARLGDLSRRACRARVEHLYSEAAVTAGYLSIYRRMVGRRRQRAA